MSRKNYFKWTKEKDEILKEYYRYADWNFLFEALGTNDRIVVRNRAKKLKLIQDKFWTPEKEDILIKNYSGVKWENLFEMLGTSNKEMIKARAYLLGVKRKSNEYTEEEIKFIKENYLFLSYQEIAKILNRPLPSLTVKINRLNLGKFLRWTDEEIEILKREYPNSTAKRIERLFLKNRNFDTITKKAIELGLEKNENKGNKFYHPEDLIDDLKQLAAELGRTPIAAELTKHGLASRGIYSKYFGNYYKACELAELEVNRALYGHRTSKMLYSKNNDNCYSNSEVIVTNFFIENNINYKKEELYKKHCGDERCKQKRTDWIINDEIFVEFFGYPNVKEYKEKMILKRSICQDNNLRLIELYEEDLNKLHIIFDEFINKNP